MPEVDTQHLVEYSLKDISRVVVELIKEGKDQNIWLFYGNLGAGKTPLIKAICRHLGVQDRLLSSPTFSIINEYPVATGKIFHLDFYRINNETEIFDLGVEEYFDSGHLCLIEWPERLGSLVPDRYFKIVITDSGRDSRIIEYENNA